MTVLDRKKNLTWTGLPTWAEDQKSVTDEWPVEYGSEPTETPPPSREGLANLVVQVSGFGRDPRAASDFRLRSLLDQRNIGLSGKAAGRSGILVSPSPTKEELHRPSAQETKGSHGIVGATFSELKEQIRRLAEAIQRFPGLAESGTSDADLIQAIESVRRARKWLPHFVEAKPHQRKSYRDFLLEYTNARGILTAAKEGYEETGREAYLLDAVSLLEDFGKDAWPALKRIVREDWDRCDLFMNLIVTCPGVPDGERTTALVRLAEHSDPYRRLEILEHLPGCPANVQRAVLEVLSKDETEDVRELAQERLEWMAD